MTLDMDRTIVTKDDDNWTWTVQCDHIWRNLDQFGRNFYLNLIQFFVLFSIWQNYEPTLANCFATGPIFVVNGQILNK